MYFVNVSFKNSVANGIDFQTYQPTKKLYLKKAYEKKPNAEFRITKQL